MAKAVSIHIGLNSVDPKHYAGWSGDLVACEFDANDMAAIAHAAGMKSTLLLTKKATRAAVLAAVRAASKTLQSGDLLFVTYSGHGGQIDDVSGEEEDKKDETWCLYDGELIDDEVFLELSRIAAGVRVLVLSDSCHSGTVIRARVPEGTTAGRSKMMPPSVAMRTYLEHQAFYDKLQRDVAKAAGKASVPTSRQRIGARCRQQAADRDRQRVQGVRDPDIGLPGQPDVHGRRSQRRVHGATASGVESRRIQGQLRQVPRRHQGADAPHPGAEPLHPRSGREVPDRAAVHAVRRLLRNEAAQRKSRLKRAAFSSDQFASSGVFGCGDRI